MLDSDSSCSGFDASALDRIISALSPKEEEEQEGGGDQQPKLTTQDAVRALQPHLAPVQPPCSATPEKPAGPLPSPTSFKPEVLTAPDASPTSFKPEVVTAPDTSPATALVSTLKATDSGQLGDISNAAVIAGLQPDKAVAASSEPSLASPAVTKNDGSAVMDAKEPCVPGLQDKTAAATAASALSLEIAPPTNMSIAPLFVETKSTESIFDISPSLSRPSSVSRKSKKGGGRQQKRQVQTPQAINAEPLVNCEHFPASESEDKFEDFKSLSRSFSSIKQRLKLLARDMVSPVVTKMEEEEATRPAQPLTIKISKTADGRWTASPSPSPRLILHISRTGQKSRSAYVRGRERDQPQKQGSSRGQQRARSNGRQRATVDLGTPRTTSFYPEGWVSFEQVAAQSRQAESEEVQIVEEKKPTVKPSEEVQIVGSRPPSSSATALLKVRSDLLLAKPKVEAVDMPIIPKEEAVVMTFRPKISLRTDLFAVSEDRVHEIKEENPILKSKLMAGRRNLMESISHLTRQAQFPPESGPSKLVVLNPVTEVLPEEAKPTLPAESCFCCPTLECRKLLVGCGKSAGTPLPLNYPSLSSIDLLPQPQPAVSNLNPVDQNNFLRADSLFSNQDQISEPCYPLVPDLHHLDSGYGDSQISATGSEPVVGSSGLEVPFSAPPPPSSVSRTYSHEDCSVLPFSETLLSCSGPGQMSGPTLPIFESEPSLSDPLPSYLDSVFASHTETSDVEQLLAAARPMNPEPISQLDQAIASISCEKLRPHQNPVSKLTDRQASAIGNIGFTELDQAIASIAGLEEGCEPDEGTLSARRASAEVDQAFCSELGDSADIFPVTDTAIDRLRELANSSILESVVTVSATVESSSESVQTIARNAPGENSAESLPLVGVSSEALPSTGSSSGGQEYPQNSLAGECSAEDLPLDGASSGAILSTDTPSEGQEYPQSPLAGEISTEGLPLDGASSESLPLDGVSSKALPSTESPSEGQECSQNPLAAESSTEDLPLDGASSEVLPSTDSPSDGDGSVSRIDVSCGRGTVVSSVTEQAIIIGQKEVLGTPSEQSKDPPQERTERSLFEIEEEPVVISSPKVAASSEQAPVASPVGQSESTNDVSNNDEQPIECKQFSIVHNMDSAPALMEHVALTSIESTLEVLTSSAESSSRDCLLEESSVKVNTDTVENNSVADQMNNKNPLSSSTGTSLPEEACVQSITHAESTLEHAVDISEVLPISEDLQEPTVCPDLAKGSDQRKDSPDQQVLLGLEPKGDDNISEGLSDSFSKAPAPVSPDREGAKPAELPHTWSVPVESQSEEQKEERRMGQSELVEDLDDIYCTEDLAATHDAISSEDHQRITPQPKKDKEDNSLEGRTNVFLT